MWTVYKHTTPCGKVYIGITSRKPEHRWGSRGQGYRTQPFGYAVRKYGWENIKHDVLMETVDKLEAQNAERHYVMIYDATNPARGYNYSLGGEDVRGVNQHRHQSEETRMKKSESMRGEKNHNYGKRLPEWHKQRLRECRTGTKLSAETKAKIGAKEMGASNSNAKKVAQYSRDGEFIRMWECMSDAAESLCGRRKGSCNIAHCCNGHLAAAYGYVWRYAEKERENDEFQDDQVRRK